MLLFQSTLQNNWCREPEAAACCSCGVGQARALVRKDGDPRPSHRGGGIDARRGSVSYPPSQEGHPQVGHGVLSLGGKASPPDPQHSHSSQGQGDATNALSPQYPHDSPHLPLSVCWF